MSAPAPWWGDRVDTWLVQHPILWRTWEYAHRWFCGVCRRERTKPRRKDRTDAR